MITAAQVADLQPGDVVRVTGWYGVTVEGALSEGTKSLWLGQHLLVRDCDGSVGHWAKPDATLTVVARAPRPLYTNSDRTEPARGDVVVDVDNGGADWTWHRIYDEWVRADGASFTRPEMPKRLRLLVDGETGRCVP